jgi:hypothetical protein
MGRISGSSEKTLSRPFEEYGSTHRPCALQTANGKEGHRSWQGSVAFAFRIGQLLETLGAYSVLLWYTNVSYFFYAALADN